MTAEEKLESCKHAIWKEMEGFSAAEALINAAAVTKRFIDNPVDVEENDSDNTLFDEDDEGDNE